jgi:hypothetical protein
LSIPTILPPRLPLPPPPFPPPSPRLLLPPLLPPLLLRTVLMAVGSKMVWKLQEDNSNRSNNRCNSAIACSCCSDVWPAPRTLLDPGLLNQSCSASKCCWTTSEQLQAAGTPQVHAMDGHAMDGQKQRNMTTQARQYSAVRLL